MNRNIIAISGGGFSEESNAYIDEYITNQIVGNTNINICFISTASHDAQTYINNFHTAFFNYNTSHLTQEDLLKPTIQQFINEQHIIYVGGGDTQFMLNKWRETNFNNVLKNAYLKGVLLAGVSAGAMCWFEKCLSERDDGTYEEVKGLGLLKGTFCPHYNNLNRQRAFDEWQLIRNCQPRYSLQDNENLHFRNEKLIAKIIT